MSESSAAARAAQPQSLAILGDLGGTHSRMGLARGGQVLDEYTRVYRNAQFDGPAALLEAYCRDIGHAGPVNALALALAGPVKGDQGHMTNLGWAIDGAALAGQLGAERLALINDLQAQALALPTLPATSLRRLRPGTPAAPDACRLALGIGTGFNIAVLHVVAGQLLSPPSEYGHALLPQRSEAQRDLARWLAQHHPRPTIEEALAGRGLVALDAHLHGQGRPSPEIIAGLVAGEAKAMATGRLYAEALGTVLGDLALSYLPHGGIYLIGGMARALAPHLLALGLEAAYRRPGERYDDILAGIGLHVVLDDAAALLGCAAALG